MRISANRVWLLRHILHIFIFSKKANLPHIISQSAFKVSSLSGMTHYKSSLRGRGRGRGRERERIVNDVAHGPACCPDLPKFSLTPSPGVSPSLAWSALALSYSHINGYARLALPLALAASLTPSLGLSPRLDLVVWCVRNIALAKEYERVYGSRGARLGLRLGLRPGGVK